MISEDIIKIKDKILATIGGDCEKIILFGSYAYGAPKEDSGYDFYIVLKDGSEKPVLALQNIYGCLAGTDYKPIDLLANYKSRFEWRSAQPTIEQTIANKGIVLYERHQNN
jgi:predicted nucleotidyltransferase